MKSIKYCSCLPKPIFSPPQVGRLANAAGLSTICISPQKCACHNGNVVHQNVTQNRNRSQLRTQRIVCVATAWNGYPVRNKQVTFVITQPTRLTRGFTRNRERRRAAQIGGGHRKTCWEVQFILALRNLTQPGEICLNCLYTKEWFLPIMYGSCRN